MFKLKKALYYVLAQYHETEFSELQLVLSRWITNENRAATVAVILDITATAHTHYCSSVLQCPISINRMKYALISSLHKTMGIFGGFTGLNHPKI